MTNPTDQKCLCGSTYIHGVQHDGSVDACAPLLAMWARDARLDQHSENQDAARFENAR